MTGVPESPLSPHNLLITTPNAILLRETDLNRAVFECSSSDGILSARAAPDNSALLAVADSQLVILYDVNRGKDRKYRLKSGDGDPRTLLFSPDARTLYFTTTLSHAIQVYSISTPELLPPLHLHPSPPSILALSKDGNVLLSASLNPPTTYIQDLGTSGSAPMLFQPNSTKRGVACAAFQEITSIRSSSCLFLLGFVDGSLVVYRLFVPTNPDVLDRRSSIMDTQASSLRQPFELGSFKKLHKPAMGGIAAAEFLPSFRSRVVTIGHDGRCRLVDFGDGGQILRTWHVPGPATCLSVKPKVFETTGRKDSTVLLSGDSAEDKVYQATKTLIAIGTQAGKVLVFNILGLLAQEIEVGSPVTGVEWVGDMSAPSPLPNRRFSSPELVRPDPELVAWTALDAILGEDGIVSANEDTGTVHRIKSPLRLSGVTSPVPVGRTRDLFSSKVERRSYSRIQRGFSNRIPRKPSEVSDGSPRPIDVTARHPRKSYPRPRIKTETFKSPHPSTTSSSLTTPGSIARPIIPQLQETRRWSQIRQAPNVPLMSGALGLHHDGIHENDAVESEKEESDVEIFVTPPTSNRSQRALEAPPKPTRTVSFEAKSPPQSIAFNRSSPPKSISQSPNGVPQQAPFVSPSSPKEVDEVGYRKISWLGPRPSSSSSPTTPLPQMSRRKKPFSDVDAIDKLLFWEAEPEKQQRGIARRGSKDDAAISAKKLPSVHDSGSEMEIVSDDMASRNQLLRDNERLKAEMEALKHEFQLLKEFVKMRPG